MTHARNTRRFVVTLSLLVVALPALVWARQPSKPKVVLTVKADKNEKEQVKPDQVITYTITCHNQGEGLARKAEIVNPVPRNTTCIPGSATSTRDLKTLFSINGGRVYAEWPIRVRDEKTKKMQEVSPTQITHVKWILKKNLLPGKEVVVKYQVRVK